MQALTRHILILLATASLWGCGSSSSGDASDAIDLTYALARRYTGQATNTLHIEVPGGVDDRYLFSLHSSGADTSIAQDDLRTLETQDVTFTHADVGVYYADFKVQRANGVPYIFEILTWEYSTERPDAPIISFARRATRTLVNSLLVSDSRTTNTTEIWVGGDVSTAGRATVQDGGFWEELALTQLSLPVTLTPGDGVKTVQAKFRNVFGNEGELGVPAEIILKQTPPTGCDAEALQTTIANNKLTLKLHASDPYPVTYSVTGDVGAVVDQKAFSDGDVVYLYVEPSPGAKSVTVTIEDIAGNICLEKEIAVTLDPSYESEGIWVDGATYWTESENAVLDVRFDHFATQEPLELKITGDVTGANANTWIPYGAAIPVTLTPTTSGSRRIFAQYRDAHGQESYQIGKRIFLKPTVTLVDAVLPVKDVVASQIQDAASITIAGCAETYAAVAWQAAFSCTPSAATVDVTWNFSDGTTLTKSATP